MFNLSDEIADQYYLRSYGVREKINANKFIFDQYHQLKLIEPVKTKIVSKVRFICNFFGIYTYIFSNEATYFVGIRTSLWRDSRIHRFPHFVARPGSGGSLGVNHRMLIADSSKNLHDAISRLLYVKIRHDILPMFAAILRASSLVSNFAAEIDLAVVSSGSNAGPEAKENGRPDHERDHNCVP